MRVVLISDTHGLHDDMPPIPDGDVLVHAGDLTARGTPRQASEALQWLAALPHPHKIFVAGNHDWVFERDPDRAQTLAPAGVTYLQDSGVVIDGVRFWGSPWQPEFCQWAFNLPRGDALARVWAQVPDDTHVLVTHTPPLGIQDRVIGGCQVGCADLRRRLLELRDLRLHAFGHIHEDYGATELEDCSFVNASICTIRYQPVNPPVIVEL